MGVNMITMQMEPTSSLHDKCNPARLPPEGHHDICGVSFIYTLNAPFFSVGLDHWFYRFMYVLQGLGFRVRDRQGARNLVKSCSDTAT